jgi:ABC-type uncharacterized transport system substrate-binding protein
MIRHLIGRYGLVLSSLVILAGLPAPAFAHPHVMVSVASTLIVNDAGIVTAIRHAWTFDEAFSAYSTMGMDTDKDGKFSREELEPLAKVNVESLHEYGFFTYAKQGKDSLTFADVADYALEHDGKALTLRFTLPVKSGAFDVKSGTLEVYDPTYFVAFTFGDGEPVKVEGGREACFANYNLPKPGIVQRLSKMSESMFDSLQPGAEADWATKITFQCKPRP